MNERLHQLIASVFAELRVYRDFRLPMEVVISGSGQGFVGFRIDESGIVHEEFRSDHQGISFPLVIRVFDESGKRHRLTILDDCNDHSHEMRNQTEQEMLQ